MKVVAVTGGIGAGKSVVCKVLECLGYPVYDCDSRAKAIMDADMNIKCQVAQQISPLALTADGELDRKHISEIVFADPEKLSTLNSIVHAAVRCDIANWLDTCHSPIAFVETAILYQSGLDRMVDEVWEVEAPIPVRIERVMHRSKLTPEQILARIESQKIDVNTPHRCIRHILNDGHASVLLQIDSNISRALS